MTSGDFRDVKRSCLLRPSLPGSPKGLWGMNSLGPWPPTERPEWAPYHPTQAGPPDETPRGGEGRHLRGASKVSLPVLWDPSFLNGAPCLRATPSGANVGPRRPKRVTRELRRGGAWTQEENFSPKPESHPTGNDSSRPLSTTVLGEERKTRSDHRGPLK